MMPDQPVTPADKQAHILRAALRLLVRQGFHGTPTSQIAREAGVSNGTLFHYYPTKDDLVIALYNHIKHALQAYLQGKLQAAESVEARFRITFLSSVHWALEHPEHFYYVQQFHFSPHFGKIPKETIAQQSRLHLSLIEEAVAASVIKPLPVDFIFTLISSHVFGLHHYLVNRPLDPSGQQRLLEEGFDLIWQMLKA
jgi:AcrR family transcriptional regulator